MAASRVNPFLLSLHPPSNAEYRPQLSFIKSSVWPDRESSAAYQRCVLNQLYHLAGYKIQYLIIRDGLWNFSVQVQSWSEKTESDPVLIRNHVCYFASWGKIDTAFWHFQNLTGKCLFCHQRQKHCWNYFVIMQNCLVDLVKWKGWYTWTGACVVFVTWPKTVNLTQNLNPKLKPKT